MIAIIGCKKENTTTYYPIDNQQKVGYFPYGFGTVSGIPVCKPFVLPPNVEIRGNIQSSVGKSSSFNKLSQDISQKESYAFIGSGALKFYIRFCNKNSSQQKIIIPAGLILCSQDTLSQNATTTQNDTIIIPPHDSLICVLFAFCTNKQRTFKNVYYDILGTTLHQSLYELVQILNHKQKLNWYDIETIQNVIWHITNGSGMTNEDRVYLNNLP
jgi:hypothetical protein